MDYREAVSEIESRGRFASKSGLYNFGVMYEKLGLKVSARTIHIAGTNGKGSTAVFTARILARAGYKVGLFTSPHLISYTERISLVEGDITSNISEEEFAGFAGEVVETDYGLSPTIFDCLLAVALMYFESSSCDVVILETGLGGRLDSTSAVPMIPSVSCITSIGLDHTAILGDTIREIAAEKAGIIRAGTRAVIGEMEKEAEEVIIERCRSLGVPFVKASGVIGGRADTYQKKNLNTALCVCREFGADISGIDPRAFLTEAGVPGRLQIVSEEPFILVDVAHNGQGTGALAESLRQMFPGEKFVIAVSMLAERNAREVFAPMMSLAERAYVFKASGERAADVNFIAECFRENGTVVDICDNINDIRAIADKAGSEGLRTVVFGSFYFVGEVLAFYNGSEI